MSFAQCSPAMLRTVPTDTLHVDKVDHMHSHDLTVGKPKQSLTVLPNIQDFSDAFELPYCSGSVKDVTHRFSESGHVMAYVASVEKVIGVVKPQVRFIFPIFTKSAVVSRCKECLKQYNSTACD